MKEGRALADQKREADAFERFKKAYSVYPTANILFAMATSEQVLGKSVDAIRHFRQAMKMPTLHPNNLQKGKSYVAELEAKLARLSVKAPAGAALSIDGARYEGALDEPIDVEPGNHTLEATLGEKHATTKVAAVAGKEESVTITFPTDAPAPPPPPPSTTLPPSEPEPRSDRALYFVAGGLGLGAIAGAVVGVVFHGQATSAVDDARALPALDCRSSASPDCERARQLRDDRDSAGNLAGASFIAAGALAAGAGVVLFLALRGHRDAATLSPRIAPGLGGGALRLSF
ncbi:MAG: hypothetical protein KIT84_00120 [Labilithrix sp.]|nr:hypothetical protein [Labilithrix sp.]MCW5809387.1 hypothetical protein [Labilithrix sp.]